MKSLNPSTPDDSAHRVLDAMPVFAILCGLDGRVRYANAEALRLGGAQSG